jgi:hypothetical protein
MVSFMAGGLARTFERTFHAIINFDTATQCDGVILMFDEMFESRMFFVGKPIAMGGRIVLCDPHRAIVAGPSRLRGALMTSPDIRAAMAMLLAAVCANGVRTITNADQIKRGYERIDERLERLNVRRQDHAGTGMVGLGGWSIKAQNQWLRRCPGFCMNRRPADRTNRRASARRALVAWTSWIGAALG